MEDAQHTMWHRSMQARATLLTLCQKAKLTPTLHTLCRNSYCSGMLLCGRCMCSEAHTNLLHVDLQIAGIQLRLNARRRLSQLIKADRPVANEGRRNPDACTGRGALAQLDTSCSTLRTCFYLCVLATPFSGTGP